MKCQQKRRWPASISASTPVSWPRRWRRDCEGRRDRARRWFKFGSSSNLPCDLCRNQQDHMMSLQVQSMINVQRSTEFPSRAKAPLVPITHAKRRGCLRVLGLVGPWAPGVAVCTSVSRIKIPMRVLRRGCCHFECLLQCKWIF